MAFVNELVPEEDIQKHDLDQLKRSYYPYEWREGRPSGYRHAWTIDRERGIFVMPVYTIGKLGRSGRDELTTKQVWVVGTEGKVARVTLDRAAGSSTSIFESPYRIIWELSDVDTGVAEMPRDALLNVLKEALTTYGHWGAHKQVPNTIVEFAF